MGHYASEMPDDDEHIEWRRRQDIRLKKRIEESLVLLWEFRRAAYTSELEHELNSIEKYYKSKLYDLRHVSDS